jgi:molecular chaperone DnaK
VRESLESEDAAAINAKTEALQSAFHAVSEAMYQRAQEQQAGGAGNGASSDGAAASGEEDVVDAEVVDEPKG